MFRWLRRNFSPRQKHVIKYFIAICSGRHIISLLPFLRISREWNGAIREIWMLLNPKSVTCGLRRIGGNKDGGYLIPDLNHVFDGLISPGIGDSFSFEVDFCGKEIRAVLIDATVSKLGNLPTNMIHLSNMLGPVGSSDGVFITLQDIRREYFSESKSLALQMDIEGAEYEVFKSIQSVDLVGIDLVLVEFHNLHEMNGSSDTKNPLIASMKLLQEDFHLVHTHPNNAGGFFLFRFRTIPKVVETTWIRKNLIEIGLDNVVLPNQLDVPNEPVIWDLNYPKSYSHT